jgi:hypothetical protein
VLALEMTDAGAGSSDVLGFSPITKTKNSQTKIVCGGVSTFDALANRSIGANCTGPSGNSFFDHGQIIIRSSRCEKRKGFETGV